MCHAMTDLTDYCLAACGICGNPNSSTGTPPDDSAPGTVVGTLGATASSRYEVSSSNAAENKTQLGKLTKRPILSL